MSEIGSGIPIEQINPEVSKPKITPEQKLAQEALEEVFGVEAGYRLLKVADNTYSDNCILIEGKLRPPSSDFDPRTPGFHEVTDIVDSGRRRIISRLNQYKENAGKNGVNVMDYHQQIEIAIRELLELSEQVELLKKEEQAQSLFKGLISGIDGEREERVTDRKNIKNFANQQAEEIGSKRRLGGLLVEKMMRLGRYVQEDITGESKIADLKDSNSREDRRSRQQRFNNKLNSLIELKAASSPPVNENIKPL